MQPWCKLSRSKLSALCAVGTCITMCSRLKASMPFKPDLALQNATQIENEDFSWSPQYNLPTTRTNERMSLSLQEVELDGWFVILQIVLETCTYHILFMHKFNVSVLYFISVFLDWRLGFEPTLQLKSWNLRVCENETCMRASILSIGHGVYGVSFLW